MPRMAVATLPQNLQAKLDLLARRFQRLRLLRGVGWVVLVAAVGAGVAMALDAWLVLPPAARIVLTSAVVAAIAYTIWRKLIQPARRRVTAAGLAGAVEEEYPRLG